MHHFLSIITLLLASSAHGQVLSWTTGPGSSANTGTTVSCLCTDFVLSAPKQAVQLGYYDDTFASPDGLSSSHAVGIYDSTTEQLIATAAVPAGTAAPKVNTFRMVDISPVNLVAGRTYVVCGTYGSDPTRNTSVATGSLIPAAGVTPGAWREAFISTLAYPTFTFSTSTVRVGAVVALADPAPMLVGDPAWTLPAAQSATTGSPSVNATEFSVSRAVDVTGLGYYDDTFISPSGLAEAHAVGVYDVFSQQLLVSATVPAGTVGVNLGNHRYVECPRTRLVPDRRYLLVFVDNTDPANTVTPQTFSLQPSVSLHSWRSAPPGGLSFPDFTFPTTNFVAGGGLLLAPRCSVDFDASGAPNPQDIFEFLNAWFTSAAAADFNATSGITPQDIFDFLNAWFTGCT